VSPPKRQPKFFIDRSLGRIAVPAGLREDGWDVVTLSEHYGMPQDEEVADTEWIADAASRGGGYQVTLGEWPGPLSGLFGARISSRYSRHFFSPGPNFSLRPL
jgi:hypothetical protein